jgi:phosphohistidine swiveling domain-containing protein
MATDHWTYVRPFAAAEATDVALTGGKGAALAALFQAGVPVPPGCIVTSRALTDYLRRLEVPAGVTDEDMRRLILAGTLPPDAMRAEVAAALRQFEPLPWGWAVRSSAASEDSATASFAGVYETVLNVPTGEVWPAIQACWASWWSAPATAYRQQAGVTTAPPHMAVVLQGMVPARCAGVAFTAEPLTSDRSRMVINAAPGLGEAVVAGVVEPEHYVLAKEPLHVLETRLLRPDQPPLVPLDVVMALGRLLLRIEQLRGGPQDVEWAWDGTQCWILQSRPITTLAASAGETGATVWGNANLKDVMPGLISPFTWSLMQPQLEQTMRQQYAELGYSVPATVQIIRRFWGRPYFNLTLFHEAAYRLYGRSAANQTAQLGGVDLQAYTPDGAPALLQRLRWRMNVVRFGGIANRVRRAAAAHFAAVEQYWREALQRIPRLDRGAFLHQVDTFADIARPFLLQHLHLTAAMSGNFMYLKELVENWMPQAPGGLVAELVTGLGEVVSAEHSYRLWELARQARQAPQTMAFLEQRAWQTWRQTLAGTAFGEDFQHFLDTYGHRCLYEIEMANPRWRERPDYLFEVLASYAKLDQDTPPFEPQAQARRRQAAEREALGHVRGWRRWWVRTVIRRTQEFSRLRENSKSYLVRLIDIGRCMALTAARLLVDDGLLDDAETVFLLHVDEVTAALRGTMPRQDLARSIAQRQLERRRYAAMQPPEAFIGERPLYGQPLPGDGSVLRGMPSSPGRVTGTARVLRSPREGTRLQAGEILVAPSTDPGWTPLFLLAAGLVMETGGYLSHGAIVAREYGIPAAINVPQATQRIPDGSPIELDGAAGTVRVIEVKRE